MARAMTPQDVHAVVNLIAQEVTGQDGTITTVNSSNFVSVGETIWSYAKENVFDALIVGDYLDPNAFFKFDFQATRTLDECVSLINKFNLESAIFLTNDVTVLKRCPSIKCFTFYQNISEADV